ncbi:MAG: B12-binding domain-containing radical SAM protein [Phycisphaerae bacterium]|nr:B12-binding domain-containing radical SAM protein [Phycisphaerae bacterium]
MNALLVYPRCPDVFWNLKHILRFMSRKAILPPLGLLTVAAMLPDSWNIKVVDMAVNKLDDEDIGWADIVFISGMYVQGKNVREVVDRCKEAGVDTVGGGPLFTVEAERFDDVDHLVLGEAEVTLPKFLADLAVGRAKHIYRKTRFADIKETPPPRWDLIDVNKYASIGIQYSRGCPFGCDFCEVTKLFGHRMRLKSAEQLITEFENLYRAGWIGSVFVVDDNFIGNKAVVKREVLPALTEWMQKRNYPFFLNTQVSINIADDEELMRMMSEAGFEKVFVGIESVDEQSLQECSKVQNAGRDLVECVKKIQNFGLEVQAGFIVGFDSDKATVFEDTINFIQTSGIVTAMVGLLGVPKGTELYNRLAAENRLIETGLYEVDEYKVSFVPKMDREELERGYKRVLSTIYSPELYYERMMTMLKSYKLKKKKIRLRVLALEALCKSIWLIGICGRDRRYFWRPFLWTLFRRPQLLHVTIFASMCGYHYRMLFEELEG